MVELLKSAGWLVYPLLLCSLLSLTVILEKVRFWSRYHKCRKCKGINKIISLLKENDITGAIEKSEKTPHPASRVFHYALSQNPHTLESNLEYSVNVELRKMNRFHTVLAAIITISPLLGILGTILGIIQSFQGFQGSSVDPSVISAGISTALVSTAMGLSITIITLLPYHYFKSQVSRAVDDFEDWISRFLNAVTTGKSSTVLGSDQ